MSKELIEKLREDGKFLGGNFSKLMHEAADALEAKVAPVGEPIALVSGAYGGIFTIEAINRAQILPPGMALYARQQAREVVMPERKPIEALDFNRTTADVLNEGWNACLDEFARLNKGGSHEN